MGDRLNSVDGRNKFWNNTVKKYGFEAIKLIDNLTESQSLEIEKQYIQKYGLRHEGGTLTNLTRGGAGGNTITPFNREGFLIKCRENKLGDKNPNYGKPTANKGKPLPDYIKQAISKANKGRKHTPEWIENQKIFLSKGRETILKNSYKVQSIKTGKIWENRIECINELEITMACFKSRIYKGKELKYLK